MRSSLMLATAMLGLFAVAARAADYGPPPAPEPAYTDNCLYLLVEGGGTFYERPTAIQVQPLDYEGPGFEIGDTEAYNESLGDSAFIDGGIGCRLSPNFRVDATAGYRFPTHLKDPYGTLDATLTSYTGLFNAYWDITNYGGFTPYVGAGVGFAYHQLTDVAAPVDSANGNNWDFIWNLQAGVSYDITPAVQVAVGYRFMDLGEAHSGGYVPFKVEDLQAHEIKAGLRFNFGGW